MRAGANRICLIPFRCLAGCVFAGGGLQKIENIDLMFCVRKVLREWCCYRLARLIDRIGRQFNSVTSLVTAWSLTEISSRPLRDF